MAPAMLALLSLVLPVAARAQGSCGPLPPASGAVVDVTPSQAASLQSILDAAQPGDTIRLTDGLYSLTRTLVLRTPRVTLRSKSGNRDRVVVDGRYATGDVLLIEGSDITIADLTLTRASWHLVHVVPGSGSTTGNVLHNLIALDGSEQFVKVNPANGQYADNGVIRCSVLWMTDAGRGNVRNNCYTGGIDIHQARGWQIYANVLGGFWCATGLSEHAIHAWTGSRDTVVYANFILNSARGIGFGLGWSVSGRTYGDSPCGGAVDVGHHGGVIANNFVVANDQRLFASSDGFDTGIGLEQACDTNVLHNTVVSTAAPRSSSIEWRFANTSAAVMNNLVTHNLLPRDGARALLGGNVANASLSMFVDAASGNPHLAPGATAAIDRAVVLPSPLWLDIDGDRRGTMADVGADEYVAGPVDTMAPLITVTSPVNMQRVAGIVPITVSASDNVGVTRVELYVDGALAATSTTAPFTTQWNSSAAVAGPHWMVARASDAAGNTAWSQVILLIR